MASKLRKLHTDIVWLPDGKDYFLWDGNNTASVPDYAGGEVPEDKRRILMFGDSLDRYVMSSFCGKRNGADLEQYLKRQEMFGCEPKRSAEVNSFGCTRSGKSVANFFLYGGCANKTLSYLCESGRSYLLADLVAGAASSFESKFGKPHVVTIKSFFWDFQRYLGQREPLDFSSISAVHSLLARYLKEYVALVRIVKATYPGAVVALKIEPMWNTSTSRFGYLADNTAVNSLGVLMQQAVRIIAEDEHLPLFDFYRIYQQLSPRDYLRDDIHPTVRHSQHILNMIMDVTRPT
jgi:hypothetical protein